MAQYTGIFHRKVSFTYNFPVIENIKIKLCVFKGAQEATDKSDLR